MVKRFKKTFNHIYLSLMLTTAVFLLAVAAVSAVSASDMLFKAYESAAVQKLDRGVSSCKNYLQSVMLSIENLALDSQIIKKSQSEDFKPITSKLDNACNYAKKINAITVYAADGRIYSSSSVGGAPSLKRLEGNAGMNDFFTLESDEFVSLRTDAIAASYNRKPYDNRAGMVSCCRKIYSDGVCTGYIVADVFPSNLYQYFDFSADGSFSDSIAVIRFSGDFFPSGNNAEYISDLSGGKTNRTSDSKYLLLSSPRNFFGGSITVGVPLKNPRSSIALISCVMAAGSVAVLIAVHFIARSVAAKLDRRLSGLLDKMDSEGFTLPLFR